MTICIITNHFSHSYAFWVMWLYMYAKDDWMSWNNVHTRNTKTCDTVDKQFSVVKVILITLCITWIIIKNNYSNQQMHIKRLKITCDKINILAMGRHLQGIQNTTQHSWNYTITEFNFRMTQDEDVGQSPRFYIIKCHVHISTSEYFMNHPKQTNPCGVCWCFYQVVLCTEQL
jgi:hypothetical protein